MSNRDFLENFKDLFYSRTDSYAVGIRKKETGKYAYPPARKDGEDLPLTDEVYLDHLKGNQIIGVWPIFDEDMVRWVALDFDDQDGEDPFEMAKEQKKAFFEAGIISYIERSQSGNGAHVWVFVDEPVKASTIRRVVNKHLVDATTFDRMFPNQDHNRGGYGNLIALPYFGEAFKKGNSAFIDDEGEVINPREFIKDVRKNRASFINSISAPAINKYTDVNIKRERPPANLAGAYKVTHFCKWMQQAKERMHLQNQEPEFYALCCQFAQLEEGESLAYEYGRMHPYSDERIKEKYEQAVQVNMPHTCETLRDEYGFECTCDIDYGVNHPFELAKLDFEQLIGNRKGEVYSWSDISPVVVNHAKEMYKSTERFGWPYGYDRLDDLTEIREGDLIVVGARSGTGKTSWAIDVTGNLNYIGVPVYWFSLEMEKEQLGMKYLARIAGVDSRQIMKGTLGYKDWRRVLKANRDLSHLPLYIDDETKDTDRMIDAAASLIKNYGKGVFIVDYVELIRRRRGESDKDLTTRAALELKGLAKFLEVPVILLSNFNRKAEQDLVDNQDPMDSWLRNSGLLEQTADVILYILGSKGRGVVKRKIRIQKERFAGAGEEVTLYFDQAESRFLNKDPNSKTGVAIRADFLRNEQSNINLL